jgi:hypothetical protein
MFRMGVTEPGTGWTGGAGENRTWMGEKPEADGRSSALVLYILSIL